jgi:hypothetical protein
MPFTETDRLLLDSKKAEICMELKLFRFKQHLEWEISKAVSRLDELEIQLAKLKYKQGEDPIILDSTNTKAET